MIKEFIEHKVNDNLEPIINEIVCYCGNEYSDLIRSKAKNIRLSLIKDEGVYRYDGGEVYVGEEPICIKENGYSHIIFPISIIGLDSGNVVFVHMLLHALGEEIFIKDDYQDAFNETVVDYMANEIAKLLKRKNINITTSKTPCYDSKSFYSRFFEQIESFYSENQKNIIAGRMGKKVVFENDEEYISKIQNLVDSVFEQNDIDNNLNIKLRK